jgi:hypothetical protein
MSPLDSRMRMPMKRDASIPPEMSMALHPPTLPLTASYTQRRMRSPKAAMFSALYRKPMPWVGIIMAMIELTPSATPYDRRWRLS